MRRRCGQLAVVATSKADARELAENSREIYQKISGPYAVSEFRSSVRVSIILTCLPAPLQYQASLSLSLSVCVHARACNFAHNIR